MLDKFYRLFYTNLDLEGVLHLDEGTLYKACEIFHSVWYS
jgi:hypothetical protein